MEDRALSLGPVTAMSKATTYISRSGIAACNDQDLFAFMKDMRNFGTLIPEGAVTEWHASEDKCSFRIEKAGKVKAELSGARPFSGIDYVAETYLTGKVSVTLNIEPDSTEQSRVTLTVSAFLNPFVKLAVGDKAVMFLNEFISAVENFDGYGKIRGYSRSL